VILNFGFYLFGRDLLQLLFKLFVTVVAYIHYVLSCLIIFAIVNNVLLLCVLGFGFQLRAGKVSSDTVN